MNASNASLLDYVTKQALLRQQAMLRHRASIITSSSHQLFQHYLIWRMNLR